MAKPARGLPEDFSLNLPDEGPVKIGDFLDEEPPQIPVRKTRERAEPAPHVEQFVPAAELERVLPRAVEVRAGERISPRPVPRNASQPSVIRRQLNLTPKSQTQLEELV